VLVANVSRSVDDHTAIVTLHDDNGHFISSELSNSEAMERRLPWRLNIAPLGTWTSARQPFHFGSAARH
jgi:hypothetical protein